MELQSDTFVILTSSCKGSVWSCGLDCGLSCSSGQWSSLGQVFSASGRRGDRRRASQAPVWLVFTSPCGWVIAEVAFHLAITCAADKVHVSASERPPQEPQCWLQGASFCWGALLSVVPGPQRMLSHLFCLPVWEIVAQQLESCLVEHRRPSRAGG